MTHITALSQLEGLRSVSFIAEPSNRALSIELDNQILAVSNWSLPWLKLVTPLSDTVQRELAQFVNESAYNDLTINHVILVIIRRIQWKRPHKSGGWLNLGID